MSKIQVTEVSDGTMFEGNSVQEVAKKIAQHHPNMVEAYYLTPNAENFYQYVERMMKVTKNTVSREDIVLMCAVLDKIQALPFDKTEYLGRKLDEFKIPADLNKFILPRKLVLGIGDHWKSADFMFHVPDSVIDEWAEKAYPGTKALLAKSDDEVYTHYLNGVYALYSAFRLPPNVTMLSKVPSVAQLQGDVVMRTGVNEYVHEDSDRPIPALITPLEDRWNGYGVRLVMENLLYEVTLGLATGKVSVVAAPAD